MSLVILDTDAASAVLRNRTSDRFRAVTAGKTICITFVALGELTTWTLTHRLDRALESEEAQVRDGSVDLGVLFGAGEGNRTPKSLAVDLGRFYLSLYVRV